MRKEVNKWYNLYHKPKLFMPLWNEFLYRVVLCCCCFKFGNSLPGYKTIVDEAPSKNPT